MAEAPLVNTDWEEVSVLSNLLNGLPIKPLVQAFFASVWGEWRLAAVFRDLDSSGTRPIYEALDEAASTAGVSASMLSRLQLLDVDDPDSRGLLDAPVEGLPPHRLYLRLAVAPEHLGAVIKRDAHALRVLNLRRLEAEVLAELETAGHEVHFGVEMRDGSRAAVAVRVSSGVLIPVEVAVTDRKNFRSRIREVTGVANLIGRPVVLVIGAFEVPYGLPRHGTVPVFQVNWSEGPDLLSKALLAADAWVRSPQLDLDL